MTDKTIHAYSPSEIIQQKRNCLDFDGVWKDLIGIPEDRGVWLIWGNSGTGKSSFMMQLTRYLCRFFKKVGYNSLEEGRRSSFAKNLLRYNMNEFDGILYVYDSVKYTGMLEILQRRNSPSAMIIDSFQYTGIRNFETYMDFIRQVPDKLIIFVSQEENKLPKGGGQYVMYDADVKIRIEGYRAFAKTRFENNPRSFYTIWDEGAKEYWGE